MKKISQEEAEQKIMQFYNQKVKLISQYINRRTPMTVQCQICKYIWTVSPQNSVYTFNENGRCPNCFKNLRTELKCANCGKKFTRTKSEIEKNKSGFFYCSQKCGNIHKNIIRYNSDKYLKNGKNYRRKALNYYDNRCASARSSSYR